MISPDQARFVIERGQRAADLLSHESFTWIVDDQTQFHLAALVASPPGASGLEAREHHHLQQHALTELVATLQGYAQAGQEMERVIAEINEDIELGDEAEDTDTRD